ncbi:hypothetical protein [Ottowia thiooxydans]|uniref:Uncharacterized protein n=1 Tax=Ottowia thiooxydans TaxID=219182 RepID=A0ABV2Q6U2_9BURK
MQMSAIKYTVILTAALTVACTQKTPNESSSKAAQQPIEALLSEIDTLNDLCRGGSGSTPKTSQACEKRDDKSLEAEKRGWCWGPQAAIGANQHWMRCSDDKTTENAPATFRDAAASSGTSGRSTAMPETGDSQLAVQATAPAKRQWFGRNPSKSSCLEVDSPAEKIREIQSFGQYATTNDLAGGVIEVERPLGGGRAEVWTFFPTMAQCMASLPRNQGINSRYE